MVDANGNRYGPYDIEVAGSEAEALTEAAWFDLFGDNTGVVSGGALTFAGLTATLAAIHVRVFGSYLVRTDPWSQASLATSTASPRRDMLVARRQRTSGSGSGATAGKTFLTILQGTPAATPAEPASFDPLNDEALWSWQVPGSGGTVVTDIRDLRRFHGAPTYGKAWRTAGAGPAMVAGAPTVVDLTTARLSGGFTFDNANNTLTVPQNGFYALEGLGYATGGTGYTFDFRIVRKRSAVSDLEVASSRKGRKLDAFDESEPFFNTIPLQAGDKLLLRCYFSSAAGTYYGISEIAGVYLAARYVGPLSGATPV